VPSSARPRWATSYRSMARCTFFAETEFRGVPIRYSVAFESSFLNVYRSCVASLAISLVLLYSVYGLLALGARSVARRTRSLIDVPVTCPKRLKKAKSRYGADRYRGARHHF